MTSSSTSSESLPQSPHDHEGHQKGTRRVYRQAILQAIESLDDFQMRSSIDAVRRLTQDILEHQTSYWNETLFLMTFKSIVKSGDVSLHPHVSAELSSEYKRQRTDSLLLKLEDTMEATPERPVHATLTSLESNMSLDATTDTPHPSNKHAIHKDPPKRRPEHDKWKIVPKSIHDKTSIVNPMDTHD